MPSRESRLVDWRFKVSAKLTAASLVLTIVSVGNNTSDITDSLSSSFSDVVSFPDNVDGSDSIPIWMWVEMVQR